MVYLIEKQHTEVTCNICPMQVSVFIADANWQFKSVILKNKTGAKVSRSGFARIFLLFEKVEKVSCKLEPTAS